MADRIRALGVLLLVASVAVAGGVDVGGPPRLTPDPAPLVNTLGMTLVAVPAGSFVMGSASGEPGRRLNEGPPHRVRIACGFRLAAHETTIGQFRRFVEATGYRTEAERSAAGGFGIDFATATVVRRSSITWRDPGFPGFVPGDDHPVILVSWRDAEAFCDWLSAEEGRRYRLPTEAEWEYAARASTTTRYWSGDDPRGLAGTANVADAALRAGVPAATWTERWHDGHAFTAPVGVYAPNPLGLFDMHGNVWEWCADAYRPYVDRAHDTDDVSGPGAGVFRAIRGGGWFNPAPQNRAAQRVYFAPTFRFCLLSGFRVALDEAG